MTIAQALNYAKIRESWQKHPLMCSCVHKKWGRMNMFAGTVITESNSLLTPIVESTYLNRDMCKFEPLQKDESRWHSTDSLKAYRSTSAFSVITDLCLHLQHSTSKQVTSTQTAYKQISTKTTCLTSQFYYIWISANVVKELS